MARILILGGYGQTGRPLARHLLRESDASLVIAGRDSHRARAFAGALNDEFGFGRAGAVRVDAAVPGALEAALRDADILVVAAPVARLMGAVVDAALATGTDCIDLQLDAAKLSLLRSREAEIQAAGRCFITEAGFHPGLPAVLVRRVAAELGELDAATVACRLSLGDAEHTEAVDELVELFRDYQAQVFQDGAWTEPSTFLMRTLDFAGEVGERRCYSLFLEELRPLPELYPSLRDLGFFMASDHWIVDSVITLLVMIALRMAPRRSVRPAGRLLWWGMRTFARPPFRTELRVDARGRHRDGAPATIAATIAHDDAYELTAIPVAACLLQYLDGSARRPGVTMMGYAVEPGRLWNDLGRMGLDTWLTAPVLHPRSP